MQRIRQSEDSLIERYVLKGPQGAVQLVYMRPVSELYPEPERAAKLAELEAQFPPLSASTFAWHIPDPFRAPTPVDLGAHRPDIHADGMLFESCEYLAGPCRYEGSSLPAKRYLDLLLQNGEEALWLALEAFYVQTFGGMDGSNEEDRAPRAGA